MTIFRLISWWLASFARRCGRYLYSLKVLSGYTIGKEVRIDFPVSLRGDKKARFGDKLTLGKNCFIRTNGRLTTGESTTIGPEAMLLIEKGGNVQIGNNFGIEKDVIIRVSTECIIGHDVFIASSTSIFSREKGYEGKLQIGTGSHIGNNSLVDIAGDVTIEDNVAIGSHCIVYTHNHRYDVKGVGAWQGGVIVKPVVFEEGAWVGSNVIVLPGVRIGKRAVIAAGSVVTRDVPDNHVYGGNPARMIKPIILSE